VFESDYIVRLIKSIGALVARAAGLGRQGKVYEAVEECERGWEELGVPTDLLDRLDGATLAGLLGDPAKQEAALALLDAEADLRDQAAPGSGAARRRLATELRAWIQDQPR